MYKPFWLKFTVVADSEESGGEQPAAETSGETPPAGDKENKPLGEPGLKALREERARADDAEKALRDAQAALEAERNAATAAKADAEQARLESLKLGVAISEGIPTSLAERLVGSTRDELVADAKSIKASMTPTFVPHVDPSQGKDQGTSAGGTVEAGKDLYQRIHGKKK